MALRGGVSAAGDARGERGGEETARRRRVNAEEIRGRAIVSVAQAEKLGAIDDLLVDVREHHVAGFLLQGGLFRGGPSVAWSDVRTIGSDAVMVDDRSAAAAGPGNNPRLADLRGRKVVTDTGDLAGTLDGLEFDPASGAITNYIVAGTGGGLFQTAPRFVLPSSAVKAVGDNLITVNGKVIDFQRAP
jgi:sporulation protein YlmC with PRC-barrel domain